MTIISQTPTERLQWLDRLFNSPTGEPKKIDLSKILDFLLLQNEICNTNPRYARTEIQNHAKRHLNQTDQLAYFRRLLHNYRRNQPSKHSENVQKITKNISIIFVEKCRQNERCFALCSLNVNKVSRVFVRIFYEKIRHEFFYEKSRQNERCSVTCNLNVNTVSRVLFRIFYVKFVMNFSMKKFVKLKCVLYCVA